jgi:hypothetical protein
MLRRILLAEEKEEGEECGISSDMKLHDLNDVCNIE